MTLLQRAELEKVYKESENHVLRQCCQIILLKSAHRKTSDISEIVDIKSQHQLNKWIKRYKNEYSKFGTKSLLNKAGQGRKAMERTQSALVEARRL